jgi:hypothetical protein
VMTRSIVFAPLLAASLLWAVSVVAQSAVSLSVLIGGWKGTQGAEITAEYTFVETNGVLAGTSLYYSEPSRRGNTTGELSRVSWNGKTLSFTVRYIQKAGGRFHGTEALYELELKDENTLTGIGRNVTLRENPFPVTLRKQMPDGAKIN